MPAWMHRGPMKARHYLMTSMIACLMSLTGNAMATTLDFEFGPTGFVRLNTANPSYGGFTWESNWYQIDTGTYNSFYGNSVTAPSGDQFVFNGFGVASISATHSPFNLQSAFFATWASNDGFAPFSSTTVTVEGYRNNVLQGSVSLNLTAGFQLLNIGLNNIDEFRVINDGASERWWLMDDLTFSPT